MNSADMAMNLIHRAKNLQEFTIEVDGDQDDDTIKDDDVKDFKKFGEEEPDFDELDGIWPKMWHTQRNFCVTDGTNVISCLGD